jgi:hypothetical protein
MIVLAAVEQQQAHQMQAVGVTAIDLKRLLATQLRVERSPGASVTDSGLIKRIQRCAMPAARLCLGLA